MAKHKEYSKGEGGGFPPSLGCGESCESVFARDESCEYVFTHGSYVH